MDCPPVADRLAAHIGTTAILRTTFHTHPGLGLGPGAPSLQRFCSVVRSSDGLRYRQGFVLPVLRHDRKSSDLESEGPLHTGSGAKS